MEQQLNQPKQPYDLLGNLLAVGDTVVFGGSGYTQIAVIKKIKVNFKTQWNYKTHEETIIEEINPTISIKASRDSRPYFDEDAKTGKLKARGGIEPRRLVKINPV